MPPNRGPHMRTLLIVAVLTGLSAASSLAQTFGEITGRVIDPAGAVHKQFQMPYSELTSCSSG
jgi:hypothetical protein